MQIRANIQVVHFIKPKYLEPNDFKNRQKFVKSPNQNICSQTLSKLDIFPESGDKFTNMAVLPVLHYQSNNCRTATHALPYCLWCNKHNTFHNVVAMDHLINNCY